MSAIVDVVNNVVPVYLFIALGYFAAWSGLISQEGSRMMSVYITKFAIPALVIEIMLDVDVTSFDLNIAMAIFLWTPICWLVTAGALLLYNFVVLTLRKISDISDNLRHGGNDYARASTGSRASFSDKLRQSGASIKVKAKNWAERVPLATFDSFPTGVAMLVFSNGLIVGRPVLISLYDPTEADLIIVAFITMQAVFIVPMEYVFYEAAVVMRQYKEEQEQVIAGMQMGVPTLVDDNSEKCTCRNVQVPSQYADAFGSIDGAKKVAENWQAYGSGPQQGASPGSKEIVKRLEIPADLRLDVDNPSNLCGMDTVAEERRTGTSTSVPAAVAQIFSHGVDPDCPLHGSVMLQHSDSGIGDKLVPLGESSSGSNKSGTVHSSVDIDEVATIGSSHSHTGQPDKAVAKDRPDWRSTAKQIGSKILPLLAKNVALYAAVIGAILSVLQAELDFEMPVVIRNFLGPLGDCVTAIAVFNIGFFMQGTGLVPCSVSILAVGMVVTFVVAPLLMWLSSSALNITGDDEQILILLAAMPQAIISHATARPYNVQLDVVTGMITVSTLLSLPIIIGYQELFKAL
eukprot:Clim_evm43s99 gene=Clim_evmTU43s99